ncbi:MAG: peptidase M29 [Burkholderiales bacterium RIFCSPHIGHO2_12_FULL_69_20]|nr:MAG: peptidase M29 [Burkholderiales bacterium RIFCSPHIGHO2_12_FULL_69_20]
MSQRIEAKWIDSFVEVFRLCGVKPGDACAILSETQSRAALVQLSELALARLGARWFHVVLPTPRQTAPVPVRSTGASDAIGQLGPVVAALAGSVFIADCTVEGLQHAVELPAILQGGARVMVVSNEHPEILERTAPRAEDEAPVRDAMRRLKGARVMQVTSAAGTDITISLTGARIGGVWGFTAKPGSLTHWPAGLVLAFPAAGSVSGTLVMAPGDVNLTFKRYLADPVTLRIADDHVTAIEGHSVDAELMRGYFAAWATHPGDRSAYAVSHVGWGLNRHARWDAMTFYDKADFNGTELRAFAGSFLYSTGANEVAGRHTLGHFDLPMRGCTVTIDGVAVVVGGVLV